mmetsp:Transcript_33809/g.78892  ORF Transcript_33809/g.78892 Transcript_33809/m.78892 type:complete len:98 (-) Transcript_33809:158-451(-)
MGRKKFGVLALSNSLLVIPETLSENEGGKFLKNKIIKKKNNKKEEENIQKKRKGFSSDKKRVFDCFSSKKQIFNSVCSIASQILQIDEILLGKGLSN